VVFEVYGSRVARAVEFRSQACSLMQVISSVVKNGGVPPHVHVAVRIRPRFRNRHAETRRRKRNDAIDRKRGRLQFRTLFRDDVAGRSIHERREPGFRIAEENVPDRSREARCRAQ
jgi:hypothetical protein